MAWARYHFCPSKTICGEPWGSHPSSILIVTHALSLFVADAKPLDALLTIEYWLSPSVELGPSDMFLLWRKIVYQYVWRNYFLCGIHALYFNPKINEIWAIINEKRPLRNVEKKEWFKIMNIRNNEANILDSLEKLWIMWLKSFTIMDEEIKTNQGKIM